ncbi:class F sortase [Jiangella asiatica]|nr:class F sortase [Jiangella asiatica]
MAGQDIPLEPVSMLPDGSMELPAPPHVGGWWAPGAAPGDPAGTVVVAGHVDTAEHGAGIFAHLAGLPVGEPISVATTDGQVHRYIVSDLIHVHKDDLPADVFSRAGPRRLAVITCTGPFDDDGGGYSQNLVVLARPDTG